MVVTIAERIHLFPSRTQKLSSLTPKVLGLDPGRIGSCHLPTEKTPHRGVFSCWRRELNFWGKPQPKKIEKREKIFAALHLLLSSLTPKVLGLDPGRIGSCHLPTKKERLSGVLFLFVRNPLHWRGTKGWVIFQKYVIPSAVEECPYYNADTLRQAQGDVNRTRPTPLPPSHGGGKKKTPPLEGD